MSIFITSDLHFGHQKEFLFKNRGFQSSSDHDRTLISKWNSCVKPDDTVYILGDVVMKHDEDDNDFEYGISMLKQLNGKLRILKGNHDSEAKLERYRQCPNVVSAGLAAEHLYYQSTLKGPQYHFYLTHAYTRWSRSLKKMKTAIITLYGHTHQKEKFYTDSEFVNGHPYEYCVCPDAHNMHPVRLDDIIEDIKAKRSEYPKVYPQEYPQEYPEQSP